MFACPQAMCFQLRDALKVGNIHLSSAFFSVQMEEREAIKVLRDELTRFAIVVEPAKTLFGKVRRTFTGKIGGQNDDLAITLQLAVSGIRCFYQNPKVVLAPTDTPVAHTPARCSHTPPLFSSLSLLLHATQYDRFRPFI